MSITRLRSLAFAAAIVLLAAGCSGDDDVRYADGTIAGQVLGTRPVAGAALVVTHVSQDGNPRGEVIAETTTDADGRFEVDTGVRYGQFLVEAHGGSSRELVTDAAFDLDADVRLVAVITGFAADQQLTSVQVSPITTMAEALGAARLARGDKETDWIDAHERALALLGAHFGDIDPLRIAPADPTTAPAGTLNEAARHGLVLAALSQLATRIADTAGVSANVVNSVSLTEALVRDLSSDEALFDGTGPMGPLMLGMCPAPDVCPDEACSTVCDIGPATVREHLANDLEAFVTSGVNVTGLGPSDIAELRLAIAKNDEPELFGGAPTDTEGAPLTIDDTGFYVDPDSQIWWTTDDSPQILGTVELAEGDSVTITVTVNDDIEVAGRIIGGDLWGAALPTGAFDPLPATNTLRVVATDGVGNQTSVQKEVRLDDGKPEVAFEPTAVIDERQDDITWGPPVTHGHDGPSVDLGPVSGCPAVYKHANLMDAGDDNPIAFRFRVTDGGAGVDPASVQYRVLRSGSQSSEPLTDWTSPDSMEAIGSGAGYEFLVELHRDDVPELATDAGDLELEARARDRLDQSATITSCWSHTPLGPPLRPMSVEKGTIEELSLTKDDGRLAELINGTTPVNGIDVVRFELRNYHDEPVHFRIDWDQPSVAGSKSWRRSSVHEYTKSVDQDCQSLSSGSCSQNWPYSSVDESPSVTINNLIGGTRVVDLQSNGDPILPCSGCGPDTYEIEAKPTGASSRRVEVQLVASDLSELHPGSSDGEQYAALQLVAIVSGQSIDYTLTGESLHSYSRCTDPQVVGNPNDEGSWQYKCLQRAYYSRYVALKSFDLDIEPFLASLLVGPGANGPFGSLDSLQQLQLVERIDWTSSENLPPQLP